MNSVIARSTYYPDRRSLALPRGQLILLLLLLGLGGPLILATIERASFSAALLLGVVSVVGLLLCRNT